MTDDTSAANGGDPAPDLEFDKIEESSAAEKALYKITTKLIEDLEERSKAGLTAIVGQLAGVASLFGFFALLPKETTTRIVLSQRFWLAVGLVIISFAASYIGLWGTGQTSIPSPNKPEEVKAFWKTRLRWRRISQWIALIALLGATAFFGLAAYDSRVGQTDASILITPTAATDTTSATVKATVSVTGLPTDKTVVVCLRAADNVVSSAQITADGSSDVTGIVPKGATAVDAEAHLVTDDELDAFDCTAPPDDGTDSKNEPGTDASTDADGDDGAGSNAGTTGDDTAGQKKTGNNDTNSSSAPLAEATVALPAVQPAAEEPTTVSLTSAVAGSGTTTSVTVSGTVAGLDTAKVVVTCLNVHSQTWAQAVSSADGEFTLTGRVPNRAKRARIVAYESDESASNCDGDKPLATTTVRLR